MSRLHVHRCFRFQQFFVPGEIWFLEIDEKAEPASIGLRSGEIRTVERVTHFIAKYRALPDRTVLRQILRRVPKQSPELRRVNRAEKNLHAISPV